MKVVELLKVGKEMLKIMSEHDIMRDDYKYVKMYEEYKNMRSNRMKHTAAIQELSDDYGVSTRTVERVVKRLSLTIEH